jgi:RNA polymerase sigma factor (sigma-70 family)
MQDSELLRDYVTSGSDAAFTGLVDRYVDFVYSIALRQLGSAQLAEEAAQVVFTLLARKAAGLLDLPSLAGWLYRATCFTTAKTRRTESRRRRHEQEAATMNQVNATDDELWNHLSPMLEDALDQLGEQDRLAVLLRFFQKKPMREVGEVLGVSEAAAKMRVSRAVERLREFFSKRGVTAGASSLAAVLSASAVQSAPIGLAATLSSAALATTTAGTGTALTLLRFMSTTKLNAGIISAVVIAAVATSLVIQQKSQAGLREQDESLRQRAEQLAKLRAENERLSNLASKANDSPGNGQLDELVKLRAEAELLRGQTRKLAALREENRQLPQSRPQEAQTPLQISEMAWTKQEGVETWMRAFLAYAKQNQGQVPTSFEQAEPFWPKDVRKSASVAADQFEILYHGSLVALTNRDVIVFREKKLWQHVNGQWGRFYGLANGFSQYCGSPDGNADGSFDEYEKNHTAPANNQ